MDSITNITVQLVSYPKPTVKWLAHTGRDWTVQQDGVQYKYILTSSIEVKEESDFKLYMLRIVNQLSNICNRIHLCSYFPFGYHYLFRLTYNSAMYIILIDE
jgi:hypothetical protein